MGRLVVLILVVLLVLGGIGMVIVGAFPPTPRVEQIQRVLPNDKFQPAR